MFRRFTVFLFIAQLTGLNAQFQFSGQVSSEYKNTSIYLCLIDDYRKTKQFLPENVLMKTKVDSVGNFQFNGDFLSKENRLYKLFVDLETEQVTDSKHLLGNCETCAEKLFIANNKDTINFPLNDLNQMLCEVTNVNNRIGAIHKIDSLQEILLSDVSSAISDAQRQIVYKKYFESLQNFSVDLNNPIAELYAYSLYSDQESFSRVHYLDDLKTSDYYNELIQKLKKSEYLTQFQSDLSKDHYPQVSNSNNVYKTLAGVLSALLLISVGIIVFLLRRTPKKQAKINYKEVLTTQEQKVFELMNQQKPNKQIAEELFVSLSTVKTHINSIYTKLSIKSRKEIPSFFKD